MHAGLRACLPKMAREAEMMAWVLEEGVISAQHLSHGEARSWRNSFLAIVLWGHCFGCQHSLISSCATTKPKMSWTWGACAICGGPGGGIARLLLELFSIEESSTRTSCPLHCMKMPRLMKVRLPWRLYPILGQAEEILTKSFKNSGGMRQSGQSNYGTSNTDLSRFD